MPAPILRGCIVVCLATSTLVGQDAFVHFAQGGFAVAETGAVATVSVTREYDMASTVSVDYVTEPGGARPGIDYEPRSGRLTFLPGQGSNGFTVPILDGRVVDGSRIVQLRLLNPSPGVALYFWNNVPLEIRDDEIPTVLDGTFQTSPGPDNDVFALALQPDGRVLIGGQFSRVHDQARSRLARLQADGSLDTGVGSMAPLDGDVYAIALQPDRRFLVGGAFTNAGGVATPYLTRLLADGSVDNSFSATVNGELRTIVLQPDGKILISGRFTEVGGLSRRRVARLNADGSVDPTFDPGTGANDSVRSLALQPDGKVLAGGQFTTFAGQPRNRLARLQPNGSLDPGFGVGTGADNDVRALAIQNDGRVLIGGDFTNYNGTVRRFAARLQADGSLDTSFAPMLNGRVRVFALSPAQKIYIGGEFVLVNNIYRGYVARLHADGSLDADFSSDESSVGDEVFAMAVQPDGRLLAGGQFQLGVQHVARLFDNVHDTSFVCAYPPFGSTAFYEHEEAPALRLPILRHGDTAGTDSIRWRTESLTAVAGKDFVGQTNRVTFQPGETMKWVEVPLLNDAELEGEEHFRVVLLPDPGQQLGGPAEAEAGILDNEYPFGLIDTVLDVNDMTDGFAQVSIYRGGDFGLSTVELTTVDLGSALPNVDYTPTTVRVTFAPGENVKTVNIPILRDDVIEGPEEFGVTLRDATGPTPLGFQTNVVVRIHDEDSIIEILGGGWGSEEIGSLPVTLIRNGLKQETATVRFRTASGTATSGQDFVGTNGVVTFQPGEWVKVIEIAVLNDGLVEGTETFSLALSDPTGNARLGTLSSVNVDIGDNDAGIEFNAPEFYASERGRAFVSLRRNDDGTGPLSVGYTLLPQTALPGVDYVPQNGVLTLAPGESNATFSVTLIDNRTPGADRSFQVKLTDPGPGASLGQQSTATVHIIDDDRPGSVVPLRQDTWPHYQWAWGSSAGSVAVGPGRKAVVADFFDYWRINSDGSLDPTFQRLDFAGVTGALILSLQPDGKVLIGGTTSNYVGGAYCLNRVDPFGARDPSFRPGPLNGSVRAIALVPDGRILVGGDFAGAYPFEGFTNGEALLRLLPDGSLDPAFRAPAFQSDRSFFSFRSVVRSVARQTDGRILAGGTFQMVDGIPRSNLARFSADGVLEATFFSPGPNGPSLLDGPLNAVTIQADGKILIGGSFSAVRGVPRPGLARLLPSGEVDLTFVPSLAPGSHSAVVKVQPDGRILSGGGNSFTDFDPAPPLIVRLEANGTLDSQFNVSVDDAVLDLALLDGGDVFIAGGFNVVNGIPQPGLARLQGGFVTQFVAPDPERAIFPLRLSAWPGARYALESSRNLADWRAVRTNTAVSSLLEFAAPAGPLDPAHQFYRARLLEP